MIDRFDRWYPDYPGQQMWQDPQYIVRMQQQQPQQPQQGAPQMTPYIDARMRQVDSIAEAEAYQIAPGDSQMFYTADRMAFIIKEQGQGGLYNLMIYDRRPPEPQKPPIDPARFVTREEFEERLAAYTGGAVAVRGRENGGAE